MESNISMKESLFVTLIAIVINLILIKITKISNIYLQGLMMALNIVIVGTIYRKFIVKLVKK